MVFPQAAQKGLKVVAAKNEISVLCREIFSGRQSVQVQIYCVLFHFLLTASTLRQRHGSIVDWAASSIKMELHTSKPVFKLPHYTFRGDSDLTNSISVRAVGSNTINELTIVRLDVHWTGNGLAS
jgi:hypothetical protein